MRVHIGKYKNFIGGYQIAEALCFWAKKQHDEYGLPHTPDWVDKFGEWLAGENKDSWLQKLCLWIETKRTRNIKVKIDYWDTWSADHTLAYIILPILKKLKEDKQGSPHVKDEDVPEELRSTSAPPKQNEYDLDDNHHKRWEYVLDEMIFAFECKLDDSWEDVFHSGEHHILMIPVDKDGNEVPKEDAVLFKMSKGENDTYKCDYDGMRVVENRIQNGFRLFGVYYQNLWS